MKVKRLTDTSYELALPCVDKTAIALETNLDIMRDVLEHQVTEDGLPFDLNGLTTSFKPIQAVIPDPGGSSIHLMVQAYLITMVYQVPEQLLNLKAFW